MTIDECIQLAERECFEPPCQCPWACDYAGCCLALEDDDEDNDESE